MKISIIVAVSENGVIGKRGGIPWYVSEDLKHFKKITMDHHILMGRKTYESIGKALPGRTSLILTKNKDFKTEGCFVFQEIKDAINFAKKRGEKELFIIGGADIYNLTLSIVDRIYLTKVHQNIDGDVYFPEIKKGEWKEESKEEHRQTNPPISFIVLSRI